MNSEKKLVVIRSGGPLGELGGISGPILNPAYIEVEKIGKMIQNNRLIFECNPLNPNERIRLNTSNWSKSNFGAAADKKTTDTMAKAEAKAKADAAKAKIEADAKKAEFEAKSEKPAPKTYEIDPSLSQSSYAKSANTAPETKPVSEPVKTVVVKNNATKADTKKEESKKDEPVASDFTAK